MFALHARLRATRARFDRALELLDRELDEHSSVAFSAGKDSTVVADLCNRVRPGIPMVMVDRGVPYEWSEEERQGVIDYAAAHGWSLTLIDWDLGRVAVDAWSSPRGKRTSGHQSVAQHPMWDDMHAWQRERGMTTVVMGLRRYESRGRMIHIARRSQVFDYAPGHPVYRRCILPIAHWTDRDVWAYLVTRDLPWMRIYDLQGPDARSGWVGRAGGQRRTAALRLHAPELATPARALLPPDLF